MELYELGMALSVVLIAALMDLLDANTEPHRQAERAPPCPAGLSAPVGSPHQGPTRGVARAALGVARSQPPTPWRHAPWIGNGEPPW
jgi:hypothetical protein